MYQMNIQLQTQDGKCLYEQIYEHIKTEIREGKLLAGEKLPSTRSLAAYLQISRATVETAYEQLLSEGYIVSKANSGYYACSIEELIDTAAEKETEAHLRLQTAQEQGVKEPSEKKGIRIDFSPNAMDMSEFPFSVWKKITRSVISDSNLELFSQGEVEGDYDLRVTISRYLHASRGVSCAPEQIIIGAGNDYLLLLLEKILGEKQVVAMENPTYPRAKRIFQSMEYKIAAIAMDQNGMEPKALEASQASLAYVMPSHQFPTGTVMPITRRNQLLKWANSKPEGRYIIEDDYDSEFRYTGRPIPSLQSIDQRGKVIYIGTFSKAIAPAIRISFMVLPVSLLRKYKTGCSFYSCTVSRIDQRILNEFIRDGYFERHVNKMRKLYSVKHKVLLESLEPLKEYFTISGDNAGLHLVLHSRRRNEQAALEFERLLVEETVNAGVRLYGMWKYADYGVQSPGIILGFGGLTLKEIQEGIEIVRSGIEKIVKK